MKENYQKNATAAAKQQATPPANVYINIAGRAVTMANAPITSNNNQQNCEDVESMKGKQS